MNFINMKYFQYTDTNLLRYVQILTNQFIITHYNLMYWYTTLYQSYISPKNSFYEINIQPHVHISWGKHDTLYLANHVILCSRFMKQTCCPESHVLWMMFSALYQSISLISVFISSHKIWIHEIDNIPINIGTTMYMLNTIPSRGIHIVIKQNLIL